MKSARYTLDSHSPEATVSFDLRIFRDTDTGLILDLSDAPPVDLAGMPAALEAMVAIEAGAIANADEGRQVGHYWLRDPSLAPDAAVAVEIQQTIDQIRGLDRGGCTALVWVGIGGSGLGPQLIDHCLRQAETPMKVYFLDNTDPEGFEQVLSAIEPAQTLVVVVSKSGGTVETRNGM
ncbi:MAG: glucose-6-phosphate isomerase, partial [Myxococcota bacterium]